MKLLITTLLCVLCFAKANAQPFAIGQVTLSLIDSSRSNRAIPVEIFYPSLATGQNAPVAGGSGEQFPSIAFGHGFSMTYDAYSNIWNELVPQGYILIFPKTETGPIPFPSHNDFALDLAFALSYMQSENANSGSLFYGKISDKTALMGHSMGGGCSFLAAGNHFSVNTVVGLAPAETNSSAISAAVNVHVPTLVLWGSKDNVTPSSGNAMDIYMAAGSTCKSFITIHDASHCGFAESNFLCEFGETSVCIGCSFIPRVQQHTITYSLLNPWLGFYLKGDCKQYAVFQSLISNGTGFFAEQACTYSLPVANTSLAEDTAFCEGGILVIKVSPNENYQWSTGDEIDSIIVSESGEYSVTVSDGYGCADTSGSVLVEVHPFPEPPVLQHVGDTIFIAAQPGEVSWYYNDTLIEGYTEYYLVPAADGFYKAAIRNQGCTTFSEELAVTLTGVTGISERDLVYFNSSSAELFIFDSSLRVSLFDLGGREIIRHVSGQVNLQNLDPGYYILMIEAKSSKLLRPLIKL